MADEEGKVDPGTGITWYTALSDDGATYYWSSDGQSTYERPQFLDRDIERRQGDWSQLYDADQSAFYFYNNVSGASSWDVPAEWDPYRTDDVVEPEAKPGSLNKSLFQKLLQSTPDTTSVAADATTTSSVSSPLRHQAAVDDPEATPASGATWTTDYADTVATYATGSYAAAASAQPYGNDSTPSGSLHDVTSPCGAFSAGASSGVVDDPEFATAASGAYATSDPYASDPYYSAVADVHSPEAAYDNSSGAYPAYNDAPFMTNDNAADEYPAPPPDPLPPQPTNASYSINVNDVPDGMPMGGPLAAADLESPDIAPPTPTRDNPDMQFGFSSLPTSASPSVQPSPRISEPSRLSEVPTDATESHRRSHSRLTSGTMTRTYSGSRSSYRSRSPGSHSRSRSRSRSRSPPRSRSRSHSRSHSRSRSRSRSPPRSLSRSGSRSGSGSGYRSRSGSWSSVHSGSESSGSHRRGRRRRRRRRRSRRSSRSRSRSQSRSRSPSLSRSSRGSWTASQTPTIAPTLSPTTSVPPSMRTLTPNASARQAPTAEPQARAASSSDVDGTDILQLPPRAAAAVTSQPAVSPSSSSLFGGLAVTTSPPAAAARTPVSLQSSIPLTNPEPVRNANEASAEDHRAATRIQAQYRRRLAEEDVADVRRGRELAVLRIQSVQRGRQARVVASNRSKERAAATAIQSVHRGRRGRADAARRREERTQHAAATRVQALQRGRSSRRQVVKRRQDLAATRVQRLQRGRVARRRVERLREEQRRGDAATRIQAVHRGRVSRHHTAQLREQRRLDAAATKVQCFHRRKAAEKRVGLLRAERDRLLATVRIQSVWRMVSSIRRVMKLRRRRAATRIQSQYRRRRAHRRVVRLRQERAERIHRQRIAAATKIQTHARRRHAQQTAARLRRRRDAATRIQCHVRRRAATRRVSAIRTALHNKSALRVQTRIRMFLAWTHVGRLRRRRAATIRMQCLYRRARAVTLMKTLRAERRRVAATRIQCMARSRHARHVAATRRQHRDAAVKIQGQVRRRQAIAYVADVRQKAFDERQRVAATRIQNQVRRRAALSVANARRAEHRAARYTASGAQPHQLKKWLSSAQLARRSSDRRLSRIMSMRSEALSRRGSSMSDLTPMATPLGSPLLGTPAAAASPVASPASSSAVGNARAAGGGPFSFPAAPEPVIPRSRTAPQSLWHAASFRVCSPGDLVPRHVAVEVTRRAKTHPPSVAGASATSPPAWTILSRGTPQQAWAPSMDVPETTSDGPETKSGSGSLARSSGSDSDDGYSDDFYPDTPGAATGTPVDSSDASTNGAAFSSMPDVEERSALHAAAFNGQVHVVQALLEAGVAPDTVDFSSLRSTPLHEAALGGHATVVEALVSAGADIGAVDHHGDTALHIAARQGYRGVVRVLVSASTRRRRRARSPKRSTRKAASSVPRHITSVRNLSGHRAVDLARSSSVRVLLKR